MTIQELILILNKVKGKGNDKLEVVIETKDDLFTIDSISLKSTVSLLRVNMEKTELKDSQLILISVD